MNTKRSSFILKRKCINSMTKILRTVVAIFALSLSGAAHSQHFIEFEKHIPSTPSANDGYIVFRTPGYPHPVEYAIYQYPSGHISTVTDTFPNLSYTAGNSSIYSVRTVDIITLDTIGYNWIDFSKVYPCNNFVSLISIKNSTNNFGHNGSCSLFSQMTASLHLRMAITPDFKR